VERTDGADNPLAGGGGAGDQAEREALAAIAALDRRLSGRLPCVVCRYDLQGLSILSVCPECGTLVRATVLAAVDPLAEELKPIERPRLVAAGLVAWSVGGFVAAVLGWIAWGVLMHSSGSGVPVDPELWRGLVGGVVLALLVAGVGALLLRRPHAGLGWRVKGMVVVAAMAYGLLAYVALTVLDLARVQAVVDAGNLWAPAPVRTVWRLAGAGLMVLIILGLRPNVRLLVSRSLVIRTGRVDRQTLLAMAVVIALAAGADAVGLLGELAGGGLGEALKTLALVLMVSAGALLTLGLAGCVADCVRIARAVMTPARSLKAVLAERDEPATRGGGQ
jgi:MFS family permease